jgi:HEPN domain-containing protein
MIGDRAPNKIPATRALAGYYERRYGSATMPTATASVPARKTRRDFQRLAELRAREAKILAKAGNQHGACYLGGFAIECALKACIARQTRRHDFPADAGYARSVYTHDLNELLKLARLNDQLDRDMRARPQLATNWGVAKGWKVDSRYETSGLNGKDMVAAVNSSDGVLEWIKLYW